MTPILLCLQMRSTIRPRQFSVELQIGLHQPEGTVQNMSSRDRGEALFAAMSHTIELPEVTIHSRDTVIGLPRNLSRTRDPIFLSVGGLNPASHGRVTTSQ